MLSTRLRMDVPALGRRGVLRIDARELHGGKGSEDDPTDAAEHQRKTDTEAVNVRLKSYGEAADNGTGP